jgi:eukaryotic-like serine/threonine-protein kinase
MNDARDDTPDFRIGTVVGKYRIERLLGRGGMGSVYEARHLELPKRFAVKFMLPEYAANRSTLHRFENEARAAASLDHANIAAVFDIGRAQDGAPFLVMDYLTGLDAAQLLAQLRQLPTARAANIVYQACLGLAVAHKAGIIHRDIKPENLFVTDAGDGSDLVKILDFGIAKLRHPDASVATATGTAMGTYYYMSPEQIRDAAKVDERTDVWALGVVLYELLTGNKPFNGKEATQIMYQIVHESQAPLAELRSDLAAGLVAVIDRALQKDAAERWSTVSALAGALAPYTGRSSVHPERELAATAKATQPSPETVPIAVGSTPHVAVATVPEKSPSRWTILRTRSRQLVWVSLVLVGFVGTLLWMVRRTKGHSQPVPIPDLASVEPSASITPNMIAASQVPALVVSASQPNASVPRGSTPAASNVPPAVAPPKPGTRPPGQLGSPRSVKTNAASTDSVEPPARRTRDPIRIDEDTPY